MGLCHGSDQGDFCQDATGSVLFLTAVDGERLKGSGFCRSLM